MTNPKPRIETGVLSLPETDAYLRVRVGNIGPGPAAWSRSVKKEDNQVVTEPIWRGSRYRREFMADFARDAVDLIRKYGIIPIK